MADDIEQTVGYTLDQDAAALFLAGEDYLGIGVNTDSPMTMVTAADPQDLLQQLAAGGCTEEEQVYYLLMCGVVGIIISGGYMLAGMVVWHSLIVIILNFLFHLYIYIHY